MGNHHERAAAKKIKSSDGLSVGDLRLSVVMQKVRVSEGKVWRGKRLRWDSWEDEELGRKAAVERGFEEGESLEVASFCLPS